MEENCVQSVKFSCSVMSDSFWPHGWQHARPPCQSPTPRVYSNSCPSSRWCHPAISSSFVPFPSLLHSFPTSGTFPMSQFFVSGHQSIGFQLQHQSFQWVLRVDVHRLFTTVKTEATWMSTDRWKVREDVVCAHSGILLSRKERMNSCHLQQHVWTYRISH